MSAAYLCVNGCKALPKAFEYKEGLVVESGLLQPAYAQHLKASELLTLQQVRGVPQNEHRMLALHTVNPAELHMDAGLLVGVSRDVQVLYGHHYSNAYLNTGLYGALVFISIPGLYLSQRRRNFTQLVSAQAGQALHEKILSLSS